MEGRCPVKQELAARLHVGGPVVDDQTGRLQAAVAVAKARQLAPDLIVGGAARAGEEGRRCRQRRLHAPLVDDALDLALQLQEDRRTLRCEAVGAQTDLFFKRRLFD